MTDNIKATQPSHILLELATTNHWRHIGNKLQSFYSINRIAEKSQIS
jgi:hypothetical protein